ncbi:phosphoprotein phosphatase [Sorangium cellulosum]|uniref:Phosphoprotein phosphatase n=1 Tax=Sorangium cellulosum TaxID=56 RepID=A0A2L0EYR9_SORCE|nr:protein phosphatase 2C domain-containing protein [Sorangium cellulosum]AUX44447.1 phosphoprotein phosphatase [Sorangium cellulosum]
MPVYRSSAAEHAAPVAIAARTDVGRHREHNEDTFLISDLARRLARGPAAAPAAPAPPAAPAAQVAVEPPLALSLAVYDGSGGASSPDAASRLAARTVHAVLARSAPRASDALERGLLAALAEAGRAVLDNARRSAQHRNSGTTATVAALCDERLLLAQVGDSRAYLLRGGELTQITRDQTLVQSLLESGKMRPEEAATFEHRGVMLQALGLREHLSIALSAVELRRGDTLLLCTDGLSDLVDDRQIAAALDAHPEPAAAGAALIDAALGAGGRDNVTVLVARFDGAWLAPPASGGALAIDEIARFDGRRTPGNAGSGDHGSGRPGPPSRG